MKILLALASLASGISVAIFYAIQGNWFSFAAYILTGGLVGACFLFGFFQSFQSIEWRFVASLATVLSVFAILSGHRAFDSERVKAHADALNAFLNIEIMCPIKSRELNALMFEGIKACALQDHTEMAKALTELQKAQSFGPNLSLIDGIRSVSPKPDADWCVQTYLTAKPLCPAAFYSLSKEAISSLEKLD